MIVNVICFLISFSTVFSQEIKVEGHFLKDSIKVGEEVVYTLSVYYPLTQDIIFPDSTYDYSPFEYHSRKYFPTRSDGKISFDSVVYTFMTFEIDTIQYLQPPVFLKQINDSATIYAELDSIVLDHVIQQIPDSIKFKENTSFIDVPGNFNYPVLIAGIGIFIVLVISTIIFFGKSIMRRYRIWQLRKKHVKFVMRFSNKLDQIKNTGNGIHPETVLIDWKKYMESLEKEPYTKLTTRELISLHSDQRLKENLRSIDRYIYGNLSDRPLHENFEKLLEYSRERYELKIEEVRHG